MASGIVSFTGLLAIRQNSDFNFTLICTDANTGNPINFTGYAAKMSIGYLPPCVNICPSFECSCHSTFTIVHTLNSAGMNPEITFDAVNGKINLSIPVAITATLPEVLDGKYDLLLYPPMDNGGTQTLIQGPIQILAGVTVP